MKHVENMVCSAGVRGEICWLNMNIWTSGETVISDKLYFMTHGECHFQIASDCSVQAALMSTLESLRHSAVETVWEDHVSFCILGKPCEGMALYRNIMPF